MENNPFVGSTLYYLLIILVAIVDILLTLSLVLGIISVVSIL